MIILSSVISNSLLQINTLPVRTQGTSRCRHTNNTCKITVIDNNGGKTSPLSSDAVVPAILSSAIFCLWSAIVI